MLAREASSREEELVAMKVVELKEELGRAEALSGNKAWLRRRLHAAIVSECFYEGNFGETSLSHGCFVPVSLA